MAANEPISPKLTPAPAKDPKEVALKGDDPRAYAEEIRARRGDISQMESPLAFIGTKDGWSRRWFNDIADRVPNALADGWRFVKPEDVNLSDSVGMGSDDVGDRVTRTSNIGDGKAIKVYLMEIPTELANEILDVRSLKRVRQIEDSIRGGSFGQGERTFDPGSERQSSFFQQRNTVSKPAAVPQQ